MAKLLLGFSSWLDKFNRFFGRMAGWLCLALVLLTTQQVIARYFFNASSTGLQELEWHLFGAIFLLAAAWTYQEDGHVRVDLFYSKFSERKKALVDCCGILFFLFPICGMIIIYGIELVMLTREYSNRTMDYYSDWLFPGHDGWYSSFASIEAFLRETILVGEISKDAGGLEARWIIKSFIPFGFFLLALQGLSEFIQKAMILFSRNVKRS